MTLRACLFGRDVVSGLILVLGVPAVLLAFIFPILHHGLFGLIKLAVAMADATALRLSRVKRLSAARHALEHLFMEKLLPYLALLVVASMICMLFTVPLPLDSPLS